MSRAAMMAVLIAVMAVARDGRADVEDAARTGGIGFTFLSSLPPAVATLPPLIANMVYLARRKPAPDAWRAMGYVFGTIDLGAGIAWLVWGATDYSTSGGYASSEGPAAGFYGVAAGATALGAASVLLAALAGRGADRVQVSPTILVDSHRNACPAIGITIADW